MLIDKLLDIELVLLPMDALRELSLKYAFADNNISSEAYGRFIVYSDV